MNKDQIRELLRDLFVTKGCRVVFWYDPDRAFDAEVNELTLDGARIWRLDEHGPLATKMEIERHRPESKFLIYAPFQRPEPRDDWLLDIYLYAEKFSADRASLLLNNLGLRDVSLAGHLESRMEFFNARARMEKFARLVRPMDEEPDIDLKILTVLSCAEFARIEAVTLALFNGFEYVMGQSGFNRDNTRWDDIRKFGMEEAFWKAVKRHWEYASANPCLKDLFLHLTTTHFHQHITRQADAVFPESLMRFVLPSGSAALNASVFVSNWMQNTKYSGIYAQFAEVAELELNIEALVETLDFRILGTADTFEALEKRIVVSCRERVLSGAMADLDLVDSLIEMRRDRFWCMDKSRSYRLIYAALAAASEMFRMKARWGDAFHYDTAETMFTAYRDELYAFDQAYRHFYVAAAEVKQGLDILKSGLMSAIENLYCNGYMQPLAIEWGRHVDATLLVDWNIAGMPSQQAFYTDYVQPILNERDTSRAYVIISDALRFEVARELSDLVNTGNRITSEMDAMLGVLPSSTSFGMAALLPHDTMMLDEECQPLLDGVAATAPNREKILKAFEPSSVITRAEDLLAMTSRQGRDLVRGTRVVYIYHNRIDAIGDKQATEEITFQAVETAMLELRRLIEYVHGCLNGSRILVTADHGFLFQMGEMASTDKSTWRPGGTVKEGKKRYVMGRGLPAQDQAWKFSGRTLYGPDCTAEIVIPKGAQRFHFTGGARFVHGGALLQEIVVPVLKLKGLKGKQAETGRAKKVDIQLLNATNMKVSNNRQRFSFLQTSKVEGKILPRTVRIAFHSSTGEIVSDEHIVTFDSDSDRMSERQKDILITLLGGEYDKQQDYYLVLTDDETGAEYKKFPFRIGLGIGNEFGAW